MFSVFEPAHAITTPPTLQTIRREGSGSIRFPQAVSRILLLAVTGLAAVCLFHRYSPPTISKWFSDGQQNEAVGRFVRFDTRLENIAIFDSADDIDLPTSLLPKAFLFFRDYRSFSSNCHRYIWIVVQYCPSIIGVNWLPGFSLLGGNFGWPDFQMGWGRNYFGSWRFSTINHVNGEVNADLIVINREKDELPLASESDAFGPAQR